MTYSPSNQCHVIIQRWTYPNGIFQCHYNSFGNQKKKKHTHYPLLKQQKTASKTKKTNQQTHEKTNISNHFTLRSYHSHFDQFVHYITYKINSPTPIKLSLMAKETYKIILSHLMEMELLVIEIYIIHFIYWILEFNHTS